MQALKRALVEAHHNRVHLPRVQRVSRALADQIGTAASILDIGCGDGTVAQGIGELVGAERVAGVDIKVRPYVAIEVTPYDGTHLPFPDGSFEAVLLSDVLHHCKEPEAVLRDALRVASRVVAIKDHFRFGPVSDKILWLMDVAGNAGPAVEVRGTYWSPSEWIDLATRAGGRITKLTWPLRVHDLPFRLITQDRLQFAARIEHASPVSRASSARSEVR